MRKIIISGIAALIAATSLATTARAEVVYDDGDGYGYDDREGYRYDEGDGYRYDDRDVVVVRPRTHIVVRPRVRVYLAPRVVYHDDCYTKKVRRVNKWGEVRIKRVRVCR